MECDHFCVVEINFGTHRNPLSDSEKKKHLSGHDTTNDRVSFADQDPVWLFAGAIVKHESVPNLFSS